MAVAESYNVRLMCMSICILLLAACRQDEPKPCPVGQVNPDNECEMCVITTVFGTPVGSPHWSTRSDGCCVAGAFYQVGSYHPDDSCQVCVSGPFEGSYISTCCVGGKLYQEGDVHPDNDCISCVRDYAYQGQVAYWKNKQFGSACTGGTCDGHGICVP